ncbi:hypothetical protein [Actinoallomurus rhizosphaericola]|uniref:hypothetical protein n=1 Tax=Actinoallomurus rhizosphaericola TaxID=2952536 RepID=UPI002092B1BF|nr:hypothetical protein [Actinoallomurus rhizosphaericola]MCO5996215.1 hypothetical protein [Actinoallomurus rhizosphaericola]
MHALLAPVPAREEPDSPFCKKEFDVLIKKSAIVGLLGAATAAVVFAGTPASAQSDLDRSTASRVAAAPEGTAPEAPAPAGVAQDRTGPVTVVRGDHHRRRHYRRHRRHFRRHYRRHFRHYRPYRHRHFRHYRPYRHRHFRHYRPYRFRHFRR